MKEKSADRLMRRYLFFIKKHEQTVMNRSARATSTRSSASLRIRRGLAVALPMRVHVYTHVCAHVCPHVYVHAHAYANVDATAVDNASAPNRSGHLFFNDVSANADGERRGAGSNQRVASERSRQPRL